MAKKRQIVNNLFFNRDHPLSKEAFRGGKENEYQRGAIAIVNTPGEESIWIINADNELVQMAQYSGSTTPSELNNYFQNRVMPYINDMRSNIEDLSANTATLKSFDHRVISQSEYRRLESLNQLESDVFYFIKADSDSGGTIVYPEYSEDDDGVISLTTGSSISGYYILIDNASFDDENGYLLFLGDGDGSHEKDSGDTGTDSIEMIDNDGNAVSNGANFIENEGCIEFDGVSANDLFYIDDSEESSNPSYSSGNIEVDNVEYSVDNNLLFPNANLSENNNEIIIS